MRHIFYLPVALCLSVLLWAGGPAPAEAAPFAFVPNSESNTVSIIDTATNAVAKTLAVGINPFGVALRPTASALYTFVTNFGSDNVSVIRTSNDGFSNPVFEKIRDIAVGRLPYGIAVDPAGTFAYVANSGEGTVSKIDLGTYETTALIPAGANPKGVAVSPDGGSVYVLNSAGGTVSVIDAAAQALVTTVRVGNNPNGIAVHPQGTFLYVTNSGENTISVVDTTDYSVSTKSDFHFSTPWGVALNPWGTVAYITNFSSASISLFDTATGTVTVPNIPVEANPVGVSLSSNGLSTYVVNSSQNTVSVINNITNTVDTKFSVGVRPYAVGSFIAPLGEGVPTITDTVPPDGAEDVSIGAVIQVTFSDTMDGSSINSSTFLLSGGVTGQITYNNATKTATFRPNKPLAVKTTYTATVTTGIRNAAGNTLASNQVWSFTTSESEGYCFIATAVYGSYDNMSVRVLRNFRDRYLLPHSWGAAFVERYYRYSPPIAHFIKRHPAARTATLWLLAPIVYFVQYPFQLAWILTFAFVAVIGRKSMKSFSRAEH